jgi:CelD/BcsL family acetyltransferase involved in cellulose biosynthesis
VIRIDEKPWNDAEIALLRDYGLEHGCQFRQIFSHLVPYLDLRQSWATFLQTRSQKLRKNLKAARRKLETRGAVALRSYESEAEVLEAFEVMLDLHQRSWKRKQEVEHSRSEAYPEFYSNWVEHMAELGQCRILVLYCGEAPVAATIAFTDRGTYYSAQIVHDAEFAACSPGTLLEAMELELLMTEGRYHTYDMMGSFLNNKLRWTDTAMKSAHALVLRRRLRTFLMDAYFFLIKPYLRPALVALYRRLRPKQP